MSPAEIELFAGTGTGVAHCPSSNMLLSSGIAPVMSWRRAGVRVGLGVDGSASNDGNDLLGEVRQAMLLQKVAPAAYLSQPPGGRGGFAGDPKSITARQALALATRGGADALGRDDIGHLAKGMSADFIAFDLNQVALVGAHDPVAALAYCRPNGVDFSVINGEVIVSEGRLTTVDLPPLLQRHRQIAIDMARSES
jgi:8-oxoguanine deaminase